MSPTDFLTGAQATTYMQHREDVAHAIASGTHYWQRIAASRGKMEPVFCEYVAAWEDPYEIDAPMKVTAPDGRCLSELMAGGIHPPIEAHWSSQVLLVSKSGTHAVVDQIDAPRMRRELDPVIGEWFVDCRRWHKETAGPMSLEQACEYVFRKDIPHYVWNQRRNRPNFAIISLSQLPKTREYRNAWRMSDVLNTRAAA